MTRIRSDRTAAWGELQTVFQGKGHRLDLRAAFAGDAGRFERFRDRKSVV